MVAFTLNLANASTELFKAQVAARIGREPHEILLKRQGERPFKDQLTLEDYGVSNGVQLDLSVFPTPLYSLRSMLTIRQGSRYWRLSLLGVESCSTRMSIPAFTE